MEKESSSTAPLKFRFRDHSRSESQNSSEQSSDVVSEASTSSITDPHDDADDLEIESITGRVYIYTYFYLR